MSKDWQSRHDGREDERRHEFLFLCWLQNKVSGFLTILRNSQPIRRTSGVSQDLVFVFFVSASHQAHPLPKRERELCEVTVQVISEREKARVLPYTPNRIAFFCDCFEILLEHEITVV